MDQQLGLEMVSLCRLPADLRSHMGYVLSSMYIAVTTKLHILASIMCIMVISKCILVNNNVYIGIFRCILVY